MQELRTLLAAAAVFLSFAACRGEDVCRGDGCTVFFDAQTNMRRDVGPDGGEEDLGSRDADPIDTGYDAGPRPDTGTTWSVTPGVTGRMLLKGRAVVTMDNGTIHAPGEVYVQGSRIECVGAPNSCAGMSQGATVVDTGGVILPGLVDAHNHIAYNWLPEWTPGRLWDDSAQWRSSAAYDQYSEPYSANSDDRLKFCAMVQWGELRSLFNGTTTVMGTGQPRTCYRWLVRNVELTTGYTGFPTDSIRANTLGIDTVTTESANALIAAMNAGEVDAYAIHLAEGVTSRAHNEYTALKSFSLLREETVIIHGTALTAADMMEVAAAGAKIVWSPSSNYVLYGATTDIEAALNAGVSVSLAPDWTLSGTDDLLHEARWARDYLDDNHPGLIDQRRLLEMITSIPADQLGLRLQIGRLAPGLLADILVLDAPGNDPYTEAIDVLPDQIRLVLLNGAPSYGDTALMALLGDAPPSCHEIDACGSTKRACWPDTPEGPVSPTSIASIISGFYTPGPLALIDCAR